MQPIPFRKSWRSDLNASFVVFLVSMPLCLGIAVASGAPTISGIIGGVIGGVVVGFLGGSPLLISGPANGLLVVSWEFIQQHGFALFLWAVFLAGALQILAGLLKLGQFFRAVTPGVILGLMTGFAIVILSGQALVVLGEKTVGSVLQNAFAFAHHFFHSVLSEGPSETAVLGGLTLVFLFSYDKLMPAKFKLLPAALLALVLATAASSGLKLNVATIDLPANLFQSIKPIDVSLWQALLDPVIIQAALLVAFIASAETLLCATAVDKLHTGPRTHYNRELTAQGLGNVLSGVLGGIPITGVIIRSSTNVQAGAKSKWSNVFSGVWLFLFIALFQSVLTQVPHAVLAAVLIHSVTKLIRIGDIRHLWDYDRFAVIVFAVTTAGVVFLGVLEGVGAGLVLSTLHSLQSLSKTLISVHTEGDTTTLKIAGAATFFRIPQIAMTLEDIEAGTKVQIDASELLQVDFSVYTMLQEWEDQHMALGGSVEPTIRDMVEKLPLGNIGKTTKN